MKIYGKEINFLFSVEARFKIAALPESMNSDERLIETALIMNEAYDDRQRFLNKEYKAKEPLTKEDILKMTPGEWAAMCDEITAATTEGIEVSVEVEEGKKKEDSEILI